MKTKVVRQNVSMYPDDWSIVEEVSDRMSLNSVSAALRFIVNEYKRLQHQLPLPLRIDEEES